MTTRFLFIVTALLSTAVAQSQPAALPGKGKGRHVQVHSLEGP